MPTDKQTRLKKPLVSIITVVHNGEKSLEQTIKSVLNQTYKNIEYIIIDGGSTDSTVDIIKKYEDRISYWISEQDNGIYDAMNKGIRTSTGNIIGMINADDWYEADAIESIVSKYLLEENRANKIYHANMNIIVNKKVFYVSRPTKNLDLLKKGMYINHSTVLVPRNVYDHFGLFSAEYKIAADWDFVLRLYLNEVEFVHIDKIVSNFRLGGISSSITKESILEKHIIRKKNNIYKLIDFYYYYDLLKLKLFGNYMFKISLIKHKIFGV